MIDSFMSGVLDNDIKPVETNIANVSRRSFLKLLGVSSGSLVLASTTLSTSEVLAADAETSQLNMFISIEPDGVVNLVCHRSEMGQGVRTSLPQILADELEIDWSKVNVVQGLADARYGSQNTDGSRSVRNFFFTLRNMGASARKMLEMAAAKTWNIDVGKVTSNQGTVTNTITGDTLEYGQLASLAATLEVPDSKTIKLKKRSEFKYIGKPMTSVDMDAFISGGTTFGHDIQLDDMLYACIQRSPVVGANVATLDDKKARNIKGVVDVWTMPKAEKPFLFKPLAGVAVLASNTWAAMQGVKNLEIEWSDSENDAFDSEVQRTELTKLVQGKGDIVRKRGEAYEAMAQATQKVTATYSVPYLAHASMETPAATAVYKDGAFEIWACTQTPQSTQQNVARYMGVPPEKVTVHVTLLGGGFGRKSKPDYSIEAAVLAKQFNRPVKVIWTRPDDIQHCYYHASSVQHYAAGLDENKQITSWIQRSAFPSISWTFNGTADSPGDFELSLGFADIPFELKNMSCEKHKASAHARIGWLRSVCNIQHGFAVGSFVDEVAVARGKSTYDTWMELLGSDRMVDPNKDGFAFSNYGESLENFPIDIKRYKNVLKTVVTESGANEQVTNGEAWGISVHRSFVSYVAVAVKLQVKDGMVKLLEMHSAIDAGTVVNPDRVRAQMEGSMIFGASIALLGEISFKDGKVQQSNYHDYTVLQMSQVPSKIKSYIIESEAPPGGVGEPGTPPVAAAIANAIFHASGQRIRDLPVRKTLRV